MGQIANNPRKFAAAFLRILDKNKALMPFRWNAAQVDFQANRTGRDLILKARQLGMSTLIQGEMFRKTVTSTQTTITLAHDAETTQKLRRMADRFYEYCKFDDKQPMRKYANATLATYPEYDSTSVIATAGNVETGRGDTYTIMHGSEVAFWKDAEKIIAGAMQGGSPDVVLESTPNGAQGFFYEKCMEALSGSSVWNLHFYPWWWDANYKIDDDVILAQRTDEENKLVELHKLTDAQIKWRRNKQKELGRFFGQEYPEDVVNCFLTNGNSYFGNTSTFFTAPVDAQLEAGHEYYAGLDFGQTSDYTAMIVIDKTTKRQVDLLHINKLEWEEQRRRIKAVYKKWGCRNVIAESNSIGSPNAEALQRDGVNVTMFTTTNSSKAGIMAALYEALHTDGLTLQDYSVLRHELNTFTSSQTLTGAWRLAAEGDGHDDTIIALALAWHGVTSHRWLVL